jgi:hypothetical protein
VPVGLVRELPAFGDVLQSAYLQQVLGNPEGAIQAMEPLAEDHPEAMCYYLMAECRRDLCFRALRARRTPEAVRQAEKAAELYRRAAEAPALLPVPAFRTQADRLATSIDAAVLSERGADADPARARRVLDGVRRMLRDADPDPASRDGLLAAVAAGLPPAQQRVALLDWEAEQPHNLTPVRLRARLEMAERNRAEALRLAEEVLRCAPADKDMLKLREEAQAGLKSQGPGAP